VDAGNLIKRHQAVNQRRANAARTAHDNTLQIASETLKFHLACPLDSLRQRSLQYLTSSQTRSHFLRHAKGFSQVTHILVGKFGFLWAIT